MARDRKPLDVRREAYRHADEYLARLAVTKSAGPRPSRDALAMTLFGPVIEAIDEALGTGDRIGLDGQLVTKSARQGAASRLLAKNAKAMRRLEKSLKRFEESERARLEAAAAQQARIAEMIAGQPARPQFRELTPTDMERLRWVMSKVAETDAQFVNKLAEGQEGAIDG